MPLPCFEKVHVTIHDGGYNAFLEFSLPHVLVHKYIGILTLVYRDDLTVEFGGDDSDFYAYLILKCPSMERVDSAIDLFASLADEL